METQKVVFLVGKKVILRPLDKRGDIDSCLRWINDEEVRRFISAYRPNSYIEEEEWFDSLHKRDDSIHLAVETKEDGIFIGVMGVHHINWRNRTAVTGAIIGEKNYWGKGYGTDAKMILLNYAFNELNLRKISSHVLSFNKRSVAYSKKCGYKIEAVLKNQIFKNGKYWDEVILSLYKKDWFPLWKKYRRE